MGLSAAQTKIVFLTDCFADLTGGAERQLYELARGLDKNKYKVTIASLECDGKTSRELVEGIGCSLAVFQVVRIYGLSGLMQGIKFYYFLKREKIDILQTYHFSSDIWGTFWAHLAGVRNIISCRRDIGFWRNPKHVRAYRLVNRWVRKIITNSLAGKNMVLQDEKVNLQKIDVIYNGVEIPSNTASLPSLRKQLSLTDGDIVIAHVANLRPVKGHVFLIQALADIASRHKNIKVLLIGEDRLNGEIQSLADNLGLRNHVLFLGKRNDVRELLSISDICVLPSLSEGMSNSILEYMAFGKAIIATNVGGNPELIQNGQTGILVEKESADAFKKALLALIENPQKRKELGESARKKALEDFSMPAMIAKYDSLFSKLANPPVKVLHLISSFGLFGAENVVLSLGARFNQNGVVSTVGALNDQRNPHVEVLEKAKESGIATFSLQSNGRVDLAAIGRLRKYLIENRINLLHTHNYKSNLIGLMAAWFAGIPVVATAHGFTGSSKAVLLYEKIDKFVLKAFFKKVAVVTDAMFPEWKSPRKSVIANGVDVQRFKRDETSRQQIRKEFGIKDGEVLIATVGRLSKEKNQELLLDAAVRLLQKYNHMKILIVGDGPEMAALRAKVRSDRIEDKVIFTGVLGNLAPVYQAMDIFVLPSLTEGVPLVILEAMASRIPIVATRVGGIPGIITDGKTGILAAPGRADELAAKIEIFLNDRQKREESAQTAFRFVNENFSQEKMFERYRRFYREALN